MSKSHTLRHKVLLNILTTLISTLAFAQQPARQDTSKTTDSIKTHKLAEVVISASRTSESILKSPVSIENLKLVFFRSSAAPSFFDALENVKGVQMLTPSMGFRIINTRGFANTTNVRFSQLVDGIDNQAPHIGAPIGNAMGPSDLDLEKVEIIPGTSSALYGLNAINGLANFITKDPFYTTGISFQQKTGLTHLNDANSDPKIFTESSLRVAQRLSEQFAFKANLTYTRGHDWIANNQNDLNAAGNSALNIPGGYSNPAYDPVNGYGNESSNRRRVTLQGRQYQVARTGYSEKDMTDYQIQNLKADLGLSYRLSSGTLINYTYRFANINNVYQRANRFALKDYRLQQHAVEIKNNIFQARAFVTTENTGNSYNLRSAAENQDRSFKSDDRWYADFTSAFNNAITSGTNTTQALSVARASADLGRLDPGTTAFQNGISRLSQINNWDIGAALKVKDALVHAEGQLDLIKAIGGDFGKKTGLDLLAGADYQSYVIRPDGNYFVNPDKNQPGATFSYGKLGLFVQAGKNLLNNQLKIAATLRVDKNDYFRTKYNPRLTAVYNPGNQQSVRASLQSGSRFPSIFEAFSNVNSGGVRRLGGLQIMSEGVFENAYLRSSVDRFQAAVTTDFNNGLNTAQAIERQKALLIKNDYSYLEAEHINSFEFGYKGIFTEGKINLDADFYFNRYQNFIAQVEMNVPTGSRADSIPYYLNDRTRQSRYRMYTNSKSRVNNIGGSLGLTFRLTDQYSLSGNISYARLKKNENTDGFEDGFNTPQWMGNVSFTGERIWGQLNFTILYKRQSSYYWQSFLVNGQVQAYGNIDTQANYDFLKEKLNVKIGASNLLNKYYYSFLGGPSIGGMYYTTLTYHL